MKGYYIIGDLAYTKTDVCVVPLLGEIIDIKEGGICKLKMCGYSPHSRRIPMYVECSMGQLDPSQEVIKRWDQDKNVIVENNIKADIDKIAKELEAHLGTSKISVRL